MNKLALVSLVVAAACSKKTGGTAAASVTKDDATAINALVPPEMKDKLTFEPGTIVNDFGHKTTFTLLVPKGWKKGFMSGSLEPADADNFGSKTLGHTTLEVGDNCDGSCEPKDWAAVVDKVFYQQYTSGKTHGKVLKDDKGKNRRTLVFQNEPEVTTTTTQTATGTSTATASSGNKGITIITTWWEDGASRHFKCTVELDEPAMPLAAAFEKVCAKVSVED